ncbi:MAG: transcription-repair coupling factor [Verrucomicrobiales bacterium]|nr:transcription-repair coupling factor [Verrucomicrobiales bacterium]
MSATKHANSANQLLKHTAAIPCFKDRLGRIGDGLVVFDHIVEPAQPFICALISEHLIASSNKSVWILAKDLLSQEQLAQGIRLWSREPLFFPDIEQVSSSETLPDQEINAERLGLLKLINDSKHKAKIVIAMAKSLEEKVPSPSTLDSQKISLIKGQSIGLEKLVTEIENISYERSSIVTERGQYALRGGIIDVFPLQSPDPVRIEFFGDEIDSIREFDIDSQSSINLIESIHLLSGETRETQSLLKDYINISDIIISVGKAPDKCNVHITEDAEEREGEEDYSIACHEVPFGSFEAGEFILQQARYKNFSKTLSEWNSNDWKIFMFFNNEGEVQRYNELTEDLDHSTSADYPVTQLGNIPNGFIIPSSKIAILSSAEIFGRYESSRLRKSFNREKQKVTRRLIDDFRELNEGDRIVHLDQGIGIYRGLIEMEGEGETFEEVLVIEYAEGAKLYVPLEQAHLISRYMGSGTNAPPLDRLGGGRWISRKAKVEKSILDYASHLIKTHAERNTFKSYTHSPDTKWQIEFENSFAYRETPDQILAIDQTKMDMESEMPMDRLICGDVGFGKTEIAIRAIFKAVMSGKQAALLCPTTVLAQQHYETLKKRFSEYPIEIDLLSRFRTQSQQKRTLKNILSGSVDVIVGTHRLVSKDVVFKNIGLAIIDEEQRFGVKHKERFKELFKLVDVLTLSATPIPRTLYLSLMGVKDMSTIDTPPPGRAPVETAICPYDEKIIKTALNRELKRKGQIFFLHNRIISIEGVREKIEEMAPAARVEVGHGQMDEAALEEIMHRFVNHKIDILVCTTIIESGIDIPNANTIIIDRADRFGLADLYQLRGRVGRSGRKAYAILMLPQDLMATGDARKRINAIRQYTELGSGFKIAMRDLEIRGSGNLLGTQQSGHVASVGFELYCKLLKQSILRLQGDSSQGLSDCYLHIDFINTNEAAYLKSPQHSLPAFLPISYLSEPKLRIASYRQIAELETIKELNSLIREWQDRFGKLPDPVNHLIRCSELKIAAASSGIQSVEMVEEKLMLKRNNEYILIEGRFPRIKSTDLEERLKKAVDLVKKF